MTFRDLLTQESKEKLIKVIVDNCCPGDVWWAMGVHFDVPGETTCKEDCKTCWNQDIESSNNKAFVRAAFNVVMERAQRPPVKFVYDQTSADKITGISKRENDPVSHPKHYTAGKIEVIDCIESMIAPIKDPVQAFLAGQVLKYIARYTLKNGKQDLEKAKWYLERLIGKVGEK